MVDTETRAPTGGSVDAGVSVAAPGAVPPIGAHDRSPLVAAALSRALVVDGGTWTRLRVVERTGSTNADVRDAAAAGAAEGLVVVAEEQTAGRGRLGRSWQAPPRSALTFSVLLRPVHVPSAHWGWLPLLAGVALADALRRLARVDARLKWPNDVLVPAVEERLADGATARDTTPGRGRVALAERPAGDRKVAGVLVERVEAMPAVGWGSGTGPAAVIGVGLNVSLRTEELPVPTATSLALAGAATLDRGSLLRAALRELAVTYAEWQRAGGDAERGGLRAAYLRRSATLGRRVRVQLPGDRLLEGTAADIDPVGRLVVQVQGSERRVAVAAGEVVHLR